MAYSAEISRTNPSCFLFVIDLSGSMADNFGNQEVPKPKAQGVSDAINRLLQNLVIKCAKSEGVRDYYYVGVVGYNSNGARPAFSGNLAGKELVPVSEIANNPARLEERTKKVDDGAGGLIDQVVKFPVWFDPKAEGGTPMTQAFQKANSIIEDWINQHPDCFPPVVIHITDGQSTDGDPTNEMKKITSQKSSDGNVLLFNLHLSSNNVQPLSFPDNVSNVNDPFAQLLFSTSSLLTPFMFQVATNEYGLNLSDGARGFVLNGDLTLIITALEIGTRPSNLR
jgi:hypothetical protein